MGFFDKLKNTFFEEEEYIEEEEEETIAKKVDTKLVEAQVEAKEEKAEVKVQEEFKEPSVTSTISLADKDLYKRDIQYFDDDDFEEETYVEDTPVVEEVKKEPEAKLYGGSEPKKVYEPEYKTEGPYKPYATQPVQQKFKPTPVISPIYGILDKNYRKEEVVERKDRPSSYVSRKNVDLDYVRNKAFGSNKLEDEFMDSFKADEVEEVIETPVVVEEENLLVDMTEADCPSVDKVTIADAEEYYEDLGLEYNVDYKDKRYEKATGRRTKPADEETMEIIEELAMKTEVKVEDDGAKIDELIDSSKDYDDPKDNLFDLIDSMYDNEDEEGEEE